MANKRLALYGFSSFFFATDFYAVDADDQTDSGQ
jgi:hypothetical protein